MGSVHRARDPELGRTLALKILLEDHQYNPEILRRFLEEARIAGQLQHPGVVPVHDIGRLSDDRPYFAMKLVEGRTLAALLAERKSPAEELQRFLLVFEQVCQTMAYAHSRGVIHRDLKPANIMVGAFGEVQVMDWGLAKLLTQDASSEAPVATEAPVVSSLSAVNFGQTQAGSVVGTPSYMAPEQARGLSVDVRADVFGLGGILCEILTGQPPFLLPRSASDWLLAPERDLGEVHRRLEAIGADPELAALARECLAEAPADRPPGAGAIAERLAGYRSGVQERLRRAEVEARCRRGALGVRRCPRRAERRARRLSAVLALAGVILLALGVGAAWWWQDQRQAIDHKVLLLLAQVDKLTNRSGENQGSEQSLESWREAAGLLDQARQAAGERPGQRFSSPESGRS